jgi:hypothetical protein
MISNSKPLLQVHVIRRRSSTWARRTFSKAHLLKRLPVLTWLPEYNVAKAKGDLVAGLVLAFNMIPHNIALAAACGLPTEVSFFDKCVEWHQGCNYHRGKYYSQSY